MTAFPPEWYCPYGLVLPQPSVTPSDNGVLYTSVASLLNFDIGDYSSKVRSCYLQKGLVARWPKNNVDQETWDDYLGIASACIKLGITDIPREILWYGIKHLFVFNTDGNLQWKDWLGRNVTVWTLMWCAAFPWIKWPLFPVLWFLQLFFEAPDLSNTSSIQLQFVYLNACDKLGFTFKRYEDHVSILHVAMLIYYNKEHPFNTADWRL